MKIDCHVHFWHYDAVRDAWITPDMGTIRRSFLPDDLQNELAKAHFDGCVAVQASQSEEETRFLLQLSSKNEMIKGIVGWIDLKNPHVVDHLTHYSQFKKIKGWRHIVQAEPPKFILEDTFCRGIAALQHFGYTYDIVVYPHQLGDVFAFVEKFPHQPFVIDHCAKPEIKKGDIQHWKTEMKAIAQFQNVYCKLSGLLTEADWKSWSVKEIYPIFDVVFQYFGTQRTMFGSDWPVMLLAADNYEVWATLVQDYVKQFSDHEKSAIFGSNAAKFYKIQ